MKTNFIRISPFICCLLLPYMAYGNIVPYNRADWKFKPHKIHINSHQSYYRGSQNCKLSYEHIVSLHDAHMSGEYKWTSAEKQKFANDTLNIVMACRQVNLSKKHHIPKRFFQISMNPNNKGFIQWKPERLCAYLNKYYKVKQKYSLSTQHNCMNLLNIHSCKNTL